MDISQQQQYDNIGIIRSHWRSDVDQILHCQNKSCCVEFGLTNRKYHCRRCGDVFCSKCTQFRKRLSVLAQPDPVFGKFYKVCQSCFDEGSSTEEGQRRDLTFYFTQMRQAHKRNILKQIYGFDRIDFEAEVSFLVKEFQKTDEKSNVLLRMVSGEFNFKRQISETSLTDKSRCKLCHNSFKLLMLRYHCNICCLLCCGDCCSDDLLLYRDSSEPQLLYRWSVINVAGSPEKEPAVCRYVRLCHACRSQLTNIQQRNVYMEDNDSVALGELDETLNNLQPLRNKIEQHLMKYEDLANSFDISRPAESSRTERSNSRDNQRKGAGSIKQLAKVQSDLSDHLTDVSLITQRLTLKFRNKELQPLEKTVLNNMKRAWCSFYIENVVTFRQLRNQFEDIAPQNVLTAVQREVDTQAVTTAYLYVHQLGLEVLLLTDRHGIDEEFSENLAGLDGAVKQELDRFIGSTEREDRYDDNLQEFVKLQIKEGKLLIKPSRTLRCKHGSGYVETFTATRCLNILDKILVQFRDKCLDTNFKNTKTALQNTKDYFNTKLNNTTI